MDNQSDPTSNATSGVTHNQELEELKKILKEIKKDDLGGMQLGIDGVMRSFDAERNIVDAVGLSPRQIELWFEGMPAAARLRFKQEEYKGVDGSNVLREKMFQCNDLPAPMSKALQEKMKEIAERNKAVEQEILEANNSLLS
jgi:hypothetical protein